MTVSRGVRLVTERKTCSIKMESDPIQVIKAINGDMRYSRRVTLIQEILEEKENLDRFVFRYCNMKNNKVADYLVKMTHNFIKGTLLGR